MNGEMRLLSGLVRTDTASGSRCGRDRETTSTSAHYDKSTISAEMCPYVPAGARGVLTPVHTSAGKPDDFQAGSNPAGGISKHDTTRKPHG
jgi:hypothetical protein